MKRLALLLNAVLLTGCMTAPVKVSSPQAYIRDKDPGTIWLDRGGKTVILETPRIVGDSLLGYTPDTRDELVVPLTDLNQDNVRVRRVDTFKTALLVGVGAAAVGGMVAVTAGKGHGSVQEPPGCSIYKKTCTSVKAPTAGFRIPIPIRF
jgi:hypothetical protein